jgi:LemA protein
MPTVIAILSIILIIAIWVISIQRKLVVLDENAGNAMNQIGFQLSNQMDALSVLIDYMKNNVKYENISNSETILSSRKAIIASSSPDDVLLQENSISDLLKFIARIAEQYPELKSDQIYITSMDTAQAFDNMVCTSCLIYNDSVAKLNREVRVFPTLIFTKLLGFQSREYIVKQTNLIKTE